MLDALPTLVAALAAPLPLGIADADAVAVHAEHQGCRCLRLQADLNCTQAAGHQDHAVHAELQKECNQGAAAAAAVPAEDQGCESRLHVHVALRCVQMAKHQAHAVHAELCWAGSCSKSYQTV